MLKLTYYGQKKNEHWQGAWSDVLREVTSKYPKSKWLQFIEWTKFILPLIIKSTPISRVLTDYSATNKSGKGDIKSGKSK